MWLPILVPRDAFFETWPGDEIKQYILKTHWLCYHLECGRKSQLNPTYRWECEKVDRRGPPTLVQDTLGLPGYPGCIMNLPWKSPWFFQYTEFTLKTTLEFHQHAKGSSSIPIVITLELNWWTSALSGYPVSTPFLPLHYPGQKWQNYVRQWQHWTYPGISLSICAIPPTYPGKK
jgi:hypothetical protein